MALPFPNAQGMNVSTISGGRGGEIYTVTNLNTSGSGSLKEGTLRQDPTVIVFDVAGICNLESTMGCYYGDFTYLGQTAPEGGYILTSTGSSGSLQMRDNNNIIKFLTGFDSTNSFTTVGDGTEGHTVDYSIWDHLSSYWCNDENITLYNVDGRCTISWGLFAEPDDAHCCNVFFGTKYDGYDPLDMVEYAFHHNFCGTASHRNPLVGAANIKIWNNLLMNQSYYWIRLNHGVYADAEANKFIYGDITGERSQYMLIQEDMTAEWSPDRDPSIYLRDNVQVDRGFGKGQDTVAQWGIVCDLEVSTEHGDGTGPGDTSWQRMSPLTEGPDTADIVVHDIDLIQDIIIQDAGNSRRIDENGRYYRARHTHEQRMIDESLDGTGIKPTAQQIDDWGAAVDNPETHHSYTKINGVSQKWIDYWNDPSRLDGAIDMRNVSDGGNPWANNLDAEWSDFECYVYGLYPIPLSDI